MSSPAASTFKPLRLTQGETWEHVPDTNLWLFEEGDPILSMPDLLAPFVQFAPSTRHFKSVWKADPNDHEKQMLYQDIEANTRKLNLVPNYPRGLPSWYIEFKQSIESQIPPTGMKCKLLYDMYFRDACNYPICCHSRGDLWAMNGSGGRIRYMLFGNYSYTVPEQIVGDLSMEIMTSS